jgi:hypothetical protein
MISHNDRSNCKSARLCYYDLLDTEAEANVPEDVRQHTASCRHCRGDISRLKTLLAGTARPSESEQRRRDSVVSTLLSLHFAWIDKPVTCKSAKPFLASLADPLLQITIPTPITVHIDKCRRCSDELSTIKNSGLTHKQLCRLGQTMAGQPPEGLAKQGDSGIATCFTFREQGDQSAETEANEMYADWPIDVQVLNQEGLEDAQTAETAGSSVPRQGALILTLKRHIKPAIAAAAVILIGFALFFGTSAASAVNLDQIYGAIEKASNIHITKFIAGETEPEREEWVSRSLNIHMLKVGQELTLWDFRSGPRKVKSFGNGAPKVVTLTKADAEAVRIRINSPLDIVPSGVPGDAKWVPDDAFESGTQDCEVYFLTWTERSMRGEAKLRKWRVFVEPGTNRPQKAQFFSKSPTDTNYVLWNELVVEYPDDRQVEAALKEASL